MSALDAARDDLSSRTHDADRAEDWSLRNLYEELYSVADYTCRIGDHTTSTHYPASKSGPLVAAAIRTRAAAFDRYSANDNLTHETADLLIGLDTAVENCLWSASRTGGPVYTRDVDDLRDALGQLAAWVERLALDAIHDPDA